MFSDIMHSFVVSILDSNTVYIKRV